MNLLYAHLLVDRSGSMSSIQQQTIDALNEYMRSLTTDPDLDAAISISFFDSPGFGGSAMDLQLVVDGKPAKDVPPLTVNTYQPRGRTPLNDAIGRTVERMRKEWHRPDERIALVIMTDGLENASTEFKKDAVKALIEAVQRDGWLVIYLGANQDAFAEGASYGSVSANTMNFTPQNVGSTMRAVDRATKAYAATGMAASGSFTEEERKLAVDPAGQSLQNRPHDPLATVPGGKPINKPKRPTL